MQNTAYSFTRNHFYILRLNSKLINPETIIFPSRTVTILLAAATAAFSLSIDTTIVGDGGPGPYCLGRAFIDTSSIKIQFPDSSAKVPPYTYVDSRNGILFSQPIDSGTAMRVGYETRFQGVPKLFSLYAPRQVNADDTLLSFPEDSLEPSFIDSYSNLSISGYKSFGVSVGSLGEVNLEQGLEVVVGGEIRPGTQLSAHLTDQGTSLEGSTREISDFDMVYVTLENPDFTVTAGDQFLKWPIRGILAGNKKIKGISASYNSRGVSVSGFGSFSGGSYTVESIKGRSGVQGPYYLKGKGEAGFISPIGGTVQVRLNGTHLEEGREKDYTVDYDLGTITFTPRVLVRQDDIIRVEYEYKTFDYRRTFTGTAASYESADSSLSVKGVLWSESDNKDQPIELILNATDKRMLKESGDKAGYYTSSARPVHHKDVAEMSTLYPLYRKSVDPSTQDTIFVYSPYDPLEPDSTRQFYTVWFTRVEEGEPAADYVIDSSASHREFVYKYAGPGLGQYSALAPLPAPARETGGEMEARLRLSKFKATVNIAGKEVDQNLFSDLDDEDNLSSAAKVKVEAGEKRRDRRSAWFDMDYRYRSQRFNDEVISDYERKSEWGIQDSISAANGYQYQSWESGAGLTLLKGVSARVGAGQTWKDSLVETEKLSGQTDLSFLKNRLLFTLGAAGFRHHLSRYRLSHRRFGKITAQPHTTLKTSIGYNDEWLVDTTFNGSGHVSGTAELLFRPIGLKQSVEVSRFRKGRSFPGTVDTGQAVTWNGSASFKPVSAWTLTADSKWFKTENFTKSSSSTFLMSLLSEIGPTRSGFSSRQEYRTNQELASRFEQKKIYVGKDLGTHVYDSTSGEFVPSQHGDHIIEEIEVYDNTSSATVRKTAFEGDWYLKQPEIKGLLGDLTWSGVLLLEEHVNAESSGLASRFPGLITLMPDRFSAQDSTGNVYYADLSYRQEIEWHRPNSLYNGTLYALPGLRLLRGHRDKTFETGLKVERKTDEFLLSAEPRYIFVNRVTTSGAGTYENYDLQDASVELVQILTPVQSVEIYMKEKLGRAFQNTPDQEIRPSLDSSFYFQIKPGVMWRPAHRGMAELSYTYSHVPHLGKLDYRIAGGYSSGQSHIISLFADLRTGKYFNLSGAYRAEISRRPGEKQYSPANHVFSMQVKAYL
ncbi:MAG: hypothetical protein ACLFVQ_07085 [Chitinispirillaceae bacterium]